MGSLKPAAPARHRAAKVARGTPPRAVGSGKLIAIYLAIFACFTVPKDNDISAIFAMVVSSFRSFHCAVLLIIIVPYVT